MTLGQRIQELRKTLGLSQEQLGARLGVSRQAISKWEADGAVPEVDKLIALGRLFGVSLNALLQVDCPADTPEDEERVAAEYARKARRRRLFKNGGHVLTAVLVLALAAVLAVLWVRVDGLERTLHAPAVPGLDPTAPLVSSFDFSGGLFGKSTYLLSLSLIPVQNIDGMTVTFQVSRKGGEPMLEAGTCAPGAAEYRGALMVSQYDHPLTISAIFDDGVGRYTVTLLEDLSMHSTGSSCREVWKE